MRRLALIVVLTLALAACGNDGNDVADDRAAQARAAARDAGLDEPVADFLALLARGITATHQVTYPGPEPGTDLVVAARPPDRRIDLVAGDEVQEVRLITDGRTLRCVKGADGFQPCEPVDAVVDPPASFDDDTIEQLTEVLRGRAEDYEFVVEERAVAGVEASCLVTRLLAGRDDPALGEGGVLCVSPEGVVLLVDQGGERLEATDYTTELPDGLFDRPDGD